MSLVKRASALLSQIITFSTGEQVSPSSLDIEGTDARIARILSAVYRCYEECGAAILSAHRDVSESRHLFDQATMLMELARSAEPAPHTNFMADIAINLLKVLENLLIHIRYEASHPIFRWIRNMEREANALEGQMHALKVVLQAELEWKTNNSHSDKSL